jgi:UDP-GlcNAc:undecaprenyl-phosphate GlcNAc-1-phosphate transferase
VRTLEYLSLFAASFVVTACVTAPIRRLAIRLRVLDVPNVERKSQPEAVPYLGGIAIALGISLVTVGGLLGGFANSLSGDLLDLIDLASTVLLPALLLGAVGLIDDLYLLSPWPRLVFQSVVGTLVATVIVENGTIGTPFGSDNRINTVVTIFWIVGLCNSINFFDNLDGAASGAVAIAALGVFVIAFDRGQELVSALSIVTAGATIGFLMWNKSPAKIYMGDAGALFLGIIISVATIRLNPGITPTWHSLAIPVMLLAVPLLDTCVAVFSRLARGLSPLTGGKDHLSHRLVRAGLTRPIAAISLWSASGVCALFALGVYFFADSLGSVLIAVFAAGWITSLALFLRTPSHD